MTKTYYAEGDIVTIEGPNFPQLVWGPAKVV